MMRWHFCLYTLPLLLLVTGCSYIPPIPLHTIYPEKGGFDEQFEEVLPFYNGLIKATAPYHQVSDIRAMLWIDMYDLNGDGAEEIFVWPHESSLCGGKKYCPVHIYRRVTNATRRRIDSGVVDGWPDILPSSSGGHPDLGHITWINDDKFYVIYRWNGKYYELHEQHEMGQMAPL